MIKVVAAIKELVHHSSRRLRRRREPLGFGVGAPLLGFPFVGEDVGVDEGFIGRRL